MPERTSQPPGEPVGGVSPRVRHILAVSGGRGGVGCSVVATNLGVYLAQLGRRVVVVDADPSGAQLHSMLGVTLDARGGPPDEANEPLEPLPTPVPGLTFLPQYYSTGSTVPARPGRKPRWARGIRKLDVDYVLLDLGAGTAPATLDLFMGADVGLCVSSPEPPSIEATYRFVRALFQRRLRRSLLKDRFKIRMVERVQSELPPLPSPLDVVRALGRYDTAVAELAATELSSIRPRLIVNGTRLRHDTELGPAMCDMARRYLGAALDYVGAIEQDDSVWLSVLRRHPLLIDSPTSKSARNIERIARRVLALVANREQERTSGPVPLVPTEPNLYDVLLTHPSATDEELRRAYKRQREIFQPDSLPLTSLLTPRELQTEQARIEEAHDTLLDPLRRRAYDISTFPEEEERVEPRNPLVDAALAAERAMLREELTREVNAETEFTGELLKKVREAEGTELEDIAGRTKISVAYLRAIEAEAFEDLPAYVYTRGFVQEVAKYLKLDPAQVSKTYLRRYREWLRQAEAEPS